MCIVVDACFADVAGDESIRDAPSREDYRNSGPLAGAAVAIAGATHCIGRANCRWLVVEAVAVADAVWSRQTGLVAAADGPDWECVDAIQTD